MNRRQLIAMAAAGIIMPKSAAAATGGEAIVEASEEKTYLFRVDHFERQSDDTYIHRDIRHEAVGESYRVVHQWNVGDYKASTEFAALLTDYDYLIVDEKFEFESRPYVAQHYQVYGPGFNRLWSDFKTQENGIDFNKMMQTFWDLDIPYEDRERIFDCFCAVRAYHNGVYRID